MRRVDRVISAAHFGPDTSLATSPKGAGGAWLAATAVIPRLALDNSAHFVTLVGKSYRP